MLLVNFYQNETLSTSKLLRLRHLTVGRSPDNDVVLADTSVSRHHARLVLEELEDTARIWLEDLGSMNGCQLSGTVFRSKSVPVRAGDDIRIGTYRLELIDRPEALESVLDDCEQTILFEGLSLSKNDLSLERLSSLYEFTSRCPRLATTEDLLDATWDTIRSCVNFDVMLVLIRDGTGAETVRTWNVSGVCSPKTLTVSRALVERCLGEHVAVLSDNKPDSYVSSAADGVAGRAFNSAMCAPIGDGEEMSGALYVSSKLQPTLYDKDDLQFLILVANHLASTLVRRKSFRRSQSEAQKLEAILGSLKEGVIVTDEHLTIRSANNAAKEILGTHELTGKRFTEALENVDHTFDMKTFANQMSFQVTTRDRGSGTYGPGPRIFAATLSQNIDHEQSDWKYVICLHDVTLVERSERIKSLFVSRLAHKIRTPLAVITGVNSLVVEQVRDFIDPELNGLLQQTLEYTEECAALIQRLEEYTSLNLAGSIEPHGDCRLDELVGAALETNRDLLKRTDLKVHSVFEPDHFHLRGESDKLSLVFHHIVQNAAKFGRPSGTLTIDASSQPGGLIQISFLDDGPGIPPAESEYLCQMLHQVDLENTGQVPGAGLGLWIARAIVQAHGGDIRITSPASETQTGTLVEISLPAARDARTSPLEEHEHASIEV